MRYVAMVVILVLACLELNTGQAVATPDERESLRGLLGVAVIIEPIKPDAQADGLTTEAVRTDVELILRSSGIRVVTLAEVEKMPSTGVLYVNVNTLRDGYAYSYGVEVTLGQRVSLTHRPQHTMLATTWHAGEIGTVGKVNLKDYLSGLIVGKVKVFASDFLAVNPR